MRDPQMSRQLYAPDFSDYDGTKVYTPEASFAIRFPKALKKLKCTMEIPGIDKLIQKMVASGGSKYFIQHKITTTTEGTKFLNNYEQWNVVSLMQKVKLSNSEMVGLKDRLDEDCVGITDRPFTDPLCYTAHVGVQVLDTGGTPSTATTSATAPSITTASLRSAAAASTETAAAASATQTMVNRTQYRPTDFLNQLKLYQEQIYVWLRANIKTYLDSNASSVLKAYMDKEQERINADTTLTEANFFNRDKRLKWEDIKAFIIKNICKPPLEGDTFCKLRTTLRENNSTITAWVSDVINIKRDIDKMGSDWKNIAPKEAMHAASRWATETERNLIEQLIVKEGMQSTYFTFDDIQQKMSIDDFRSLCAKLDPKKLPKNFKQHRSKRALKESLITMAEAQKMVADKTKELRERVVNVEKALNDANNKVRHLNKSVRINNARLKERNLPPSVEAKETPLPTAKHPFGIKTNPKFCQECWDVGLKKRSHKGACDPKLRAQALARKQAQDKARAGGQQQQQSQKDKGKGTKKPGATKTTRKHALDQYQVWMCVHCKNEDVAPKFCKHKPSVCFRRPGGPLKDIKDPVLREKKSRQLSKERREKYNQEQAKAKAKANLGVTTAIEAIPKNASTTDTTSRRSSTIRLDVRSEDVPHHTG